MSDAGLKPLRVLVTRPARDAQHWVAQLQRGGVVAEALPLIEIAPACGAASVQALAEACKALALGHYAACLFVSGNAVDYFFRSNEALAQLLIDKFAIKNIVNEGVRFMAPGPGTVAALAAAGIPAGQIDAPAADALQFDSEALWEVVGPRDWQGSRVLVVRGQDSGAHSEAPSSGRDWIARQWAAAGARVDFVGVYQRRAPRLTQAQIQRALAASEDGSIWLFSSSEAVANLVRMPELAGVDWRQARAVATHPRIVAAAQAAGWGVVVASRPALKDIRDTLASVESSHP